MILIIAHHLAVNGGFTFDQNITANMLWIQFLHSGGKVGVDVFVLISGYFLITRKTLKTEKALKLWLQVLTYSLIVFAASVVLGYMAFSKKELLYAFLPVSLSEWWFVTTYFVLFLFSPFLNSFILSLSRENQKKVLLLALMLWCVLPTVSYVYPKFEPMLPAFSNFTWFVTLYAIGAYIRLWHEKCERRPSFYLGAAAALYLLNYSTAVIYDLLNQAQRELYYPPTVLFDLNSVPVLAVSILLLLGFKTLTVKSKAVNVTASATFGVYLLHDNVVSRIWLWQEVFKNPALTGSPYLIPVSIAEIVAVFAVCTLLELFRMRTLEKLYMPLVLKAGGWIDRKKSALFDMSALKKL